MDITKIDDNTIEAVKTIPESTETVQYDVSFLLSQKDAILKQKEEDNAKRDKEIADIDELLGGADKAGIDTVAISTRMVSA